MRLTETTLDDAGLTPSVAAFVGDAKVYDSSCAGNATVWYIEGGYFLKRVGAGGTLRGEADMMSHMHCLGLAPRVILYDAGPAYEFMLTEAATGCDCTDETLLSRPAKLAGALAEHLLRLHSLPVEGCPHPRRFVAMLEAAERAAVGGQCDTGRLAYIGVRGRGEALRRLRALAPLARCDTLTHGDYCLPNVLLNGDYSLSCFIDWDCGGVGDLHWDLYWGVWSLGYNLKSYAYTDVFLDAYGRALVDPERLLLCGLIAAFV